MKALKFIAFFVLLFLFNQNISWAQEVKKENSTGSIEGTYQIQVINSRAQPYMPGNLEEIVKKNRHVTEVKYIDLGTQVKLMILPYIEISKPDFKKLEKIAHISK